MLLITAGFNFILLAFLVLAVGPAIALMMYTYKHDPIDKEPPDLLLKLVFLGVVAALIAGLVEYVAMDAFGLLSGAAGVRTDTLGFSLLSDFVVVGVVEEACKYLLMAQATWRHPAFNCRYDGIVYAVFASLGFAAMENIQYGLTYGTGVLFARAIMAIPAHMAFAVLFGLFYGEAKLLSTRGNKAGSAACIAAGYVLSVLLHGLYDSAATLSNYGEEGLFLLVVALIYVVVFFVVRWASRHDRRFAY